MKLRSLLFALLLAAGLVCVAGCGKKAEAKKVATPAEVSATFIKAIADGDQAAAVKQCTGSYTQLFVAGMIQGIKEKSKSDPDNSAMVLNVLKSAKFAEKINGDTATTAMIAPDGSKGGFEFSLKKVDGEWKVDADAVMAKASKK